MKQKILRLPFSSLFVPVPHQQGYYYEKAIIILSINFIIDDSLFVPHRVWKRKATA